MTIVRGVIATTAALCATFAQAEYKLPEVQSAESALKMLIGLNHYRCAQVVFVEKLQGSVYGVTCIKVVGRPGRAHDAVDSANNAVVRLGQ